jgi:hypothetical protein
MPTAGRTRGIALVYDELHSIGLQMSYGSRSQGLALPARCHARSGAGPSRATARLGSAETGSARCMRPAAEHTPQGRPEHDAV